MNFNYKNPITPLSSLGNLSVPRKSTHGTNFSILGTGGYMEVYSLNDLYYTIPVGQTGLIEYSANTIPIQFNKGTGSIFAPDVLTLNSDNISSGRRRIGMLVYVIDEDQIYQYQIPNFESLWSGATSATGPGGNTVVFSEFGTTIKSNSPEGIAFISAWTSNIIEGVSGGTSTNSVWKKLVTGGGTATGEYLPLSGGTVTGDTIFTSGLTATTFSAATYLGLPLDIYVTGGTYSAGTITFTNNSGGTFDVLGLISADTYTTGFTFDISNYDLTIKRNDGVDLTTNLSILASDVTITGGTYDPNTGTATFTNNTGGTFNVTGFLTGFTDIYVTGGTFDKNTEILTLERNDGNLVDISGFTDVFVTGGSYSNGTLYLTNNSGYTFTVPGFSTATGGTSNYYGSFYDTTNQVVSGANIPTVWTYNTTYISNGIYIQDGSKIKVSNSGIYEIGYSAQMTKTQGGSSSNVTIWASINGVPVTDSSSTTSFEANNSFALPFVSYFFELNAGDYVEFYFSSPNNSVEIATLSGLTSPTRPDSPSVIIVAKAIGNSVLNTSGDSFVTGFTLSGSVLSLQQNRVGMYSGFSVNLPFLPLTGGTLTGPLTATTISATTYQNLPVTADTFVTGFTISANTLTIKQNNNQPELPATIPTVDLSSVLSGVSFNIATSGSFSASTYLGLPTDIRVTGGTYSNGTATFTNNTGGTFSVIGFTTPFTGGTVTGVTNFTNGLTANTISATTYQNLPTDIRVTGGTYNSGTSTIIFTNNTGGTFSVTGITSGGGVSGDYLPLSGGTVTGGTRFTAGLTGNSAVFSSATQNVLNVIGSGSTSPIFRVQGSQGELFAVTDSLTGSLFSVNDISGLPIMEVFSDNTILMGSYFAPSLNTTYRLLVNSGSTNLYSIPVSAYTGAFYDYTVSDSSNARAGNIMAIFSGTSVQYTESSTLDIGSTTGVTFSVGISSGNAVLRVSATTNNWTVKTIIRSI